ncbi:MAG: hypothetical protein WCB68_05265 [Pyrinomonadaceae bacterium]
MLSTDERGVGNTRALASDSVINHFNETARERGGQRRASFIQFIEAVSLSKASPVKISTLAHPSLLSHFRDYERNIKMK